MSRLAQKSAKEKGLTHAEKGGGGVEKIRLQHHVEHHQTI